MATRAEIISDIELRLTSGKVSDDFQVPKAQIAHWIDAERDELVEDYLNSFVAKGWAVDPFYVTREECLLIDTEDTPCVDDEDDCWERKIATLSGTPLKLVAGEEMVHVTNFAGKEIHQVDHDHLEMLKHARLSRPSQRKLVYHREQKDIIVDGLGPSYNGVPKIKVAYVRSMIDWVVADDAEYPLSGNLISALTDRVEEVARRELDRELTHEDDINDGVQ